MLIAAGVVAIVTEGVVIYKQSNSISELRAQNDSMSKKLDTKVKKIEQEKNEQINAMEAKNQELIAENKALIKANEDSIRESQDARKAMQEVTVQLAELLRIPGVQASVQIWQEAGDMYRSNLSEAKSSEVSSCTETASIAGSESDIEVIDPIIPNTSMDESMLSRCTKDYQISK